MVISLKQKLNVSHAGLVCFETTVLKIEDEQSTTMKASFERRLQTRMRTRNITVFDQRLQRSVLRELAVTKNDIISAHGTADADTTQTWHAASIK